jgi:chromate transporter
VLTETEQVWLFVGSGILIWLVKAPPHNWLNKDRLSSVSGVPLLSLLLEVPAASLDKLWSIFIFFAQAGAFVFGSGLAIVPFLYGGVVKEQHWLNDRQFVDAVAVAMITPGPVVITVGFIGFLVAGLVGASVAALGTFLPCYLFTVIPAPYFKKYGKLPGIKAFVDGVTAAATGAISGAVIVLARRTIIDGPTMLLALVTLGLLWRFKKLPEPVIVLGAAMIGLVIYPLVGH